MPRGRSKLHTIRYKALLEHLKRARLEAGLTQEEVARMVNTTQSWLSKTERGERRIDPTELEDLARVYGVSLDYFMTGDEPKRLAKKKMKKRKKS